MPPNNLPFNPGQPQDLQSGLISSENSTTAQAPIKKNLSSTQNSLLISEIRDNMVIMVDGSYRAVIRCESINFDLMSNQEREGVELLYQSFLNSLSHPIQILIRSKRVNIGPYLEKLYKIRAHQDNMLLNVMMDDYITFVDNLAQQFAIMDKAFYVIVPYNNQGDLTSIIQQSRGLFDKIFTKKKVQITKIDKTTYEKAQAEISRRVDGVSAGLRQIGIPCRQLNTLELGELYYNFYNPDTAIDQPLQNYSGLATTYVMKGQQNDSIGGTNG